jgi:hypothetical protein
MHAPMYLATELIRIKIEAFASVTRLVCEKIAQNLAQPIFC